MTIFGQDMSHYDNIPAGGGAKLAADGISFVTHKAGGDSIDAELGAWWSAFRSFRDRLLLGAYWVLYPGHPLDRADAFLARLDDQCPGWRDGPFLLQVDCEKWNGDPATVPGRAEIAAFCDRLAAKTGLRPVVYAPKWVYGNTLSGLGYPLWASNYVITSGPFKQLYPGDGSSRWAVYSGQTPAILQYSSSAVIAKQTTCDANAYRGTLAELTALVAPEWSDVMTPDDWARLTGIVNAAYANSSKDGAPETPVGHLVLSQGIPDGTAAGQRAAAWQVLENLGVKLLELEQKVAAIGTPDPAALAQAIAAALPAELAGKVADVLAQRLSA